VQKEKGLFRRALEISILLHLLLLFIILPNWRRVWPAWLMPTPEPLVQLAQPEKAPLKFELVELPNDREEAPNPESRPAPSDLDRRAHGGEGDEPSSRPSSRGNTPQLIQAEGGRELSRGAPPQQQGPPQRPVQRPREVPPRQQSEQQQREHPRREGVGEEREAPPEQQPAIPLPPSGVAVLPPDIGGLVERPDREGGRADASTLSFDTQWYDWGPYAAAMLRKIRANWRIPEIARLGVEGVVKIRFFIERDGTVTSLRIVDESGKPPMDFAARDAIAVSSAFRPLPADLTGVEREGVTITFYYNTRPEEWGNR